MKKVRTELSLEELKARHEVFKKEIKKRLNQFENVKYSEYFYELTYCLLTPQSSAVNAGKAIQELSNLDFFNNDLDPEPLLHKPEYYIRFHKTKAKHLLRVKEQCSDILEKLRDENCSSRELREWLVKNVKGLGWKEASHFLRNIGHRNLAILDRHILKNLVRCGALNELPKTLTAKEYFRIEKVFQEYSDKIGIPMDELDLLFWSMETGQILK